MRRQVWNQGWWRHAQRMPSPNFGPRPNGVSINLVVLHSISLPPGQFGGHEVQRLFTNRLDWSAHPYYEGIRGLEVSAHFYLRRTGHCIQFVSCDQRAWHAGVSVWRGQQKCNDYSIGIELEGIEGGPFTARQMRALVRLLRALGGRYPLCEVTGHEDVAPGRKRDPGPGFDWQALARQLPKRGPIVARLDEPLRQC